MTGEIKRPFDELGETLRVAAAALREAQIPFVLGGSLAIWARGGPIPQNDLDLMLKRSDADAALEALGSLGMRIEKPPEEWLYKAWHGDVMIDLIFGPAGLEITDELLERAETLSVLAVEMRVMSIEDVFSTKLHAMNERTVDYGPLLAMARAVREQVDWRELAARTTDTPYSRPFFTLLEELRVLSPGEAGGTASGAPGGTRPDVGRVHVVG